MLVDHNGEAIGESSEPSSRLLARCRAALARDEPAVLGVEAGERSSDADSETDRAYFIDPVVARPRALIFGAGHCGQAIAQVAQLAGFRVVVMDDRAAFADPARLPWAEEVRVVDFANVTDGLALNGREHFVIVTRGHEHDLAVLRQLLPHPSAYLGMIGSERKKHLFLKTLRHEGLREDQLQRIRSPMGLPIAADTPEEIAVAVVGEMIAVRRGAPSSPRIASGRSSRKAAVPGPATRR